MTDVKYDAYYRDDPAACGTPFAEFEAFCARAEAGDLLDLGCGQGRDALMFARAGHRVTGVDVSTVGVEQMVASARAEQLPVQGVVADIRTYKPTERFDIVVLDRVLHMLAEDERLPVLKGAMEAVRPGGVLLVAEGPQGMRPLREEAARCGWSFEKSPVNRMIARRPRG